MEIFPLRNPCGFCVRLFNIIFLLAVASAGHAATQAPVSVEGAWARSTVAGQDASGVYMTLTAREPLTLLGASTPAAGIVEIHEMKMEGDVMKMRAADTLPLAAGRPLTLGPGGYHFMLMDLKAPFRAGSTITMTLRFRDAKGALRPLQVRVPVSNTPPARKA
jgi:copper(I)-binding protein